MSHTQELALPQERIPLQDIRTVHMYSGDALYMANGLQLIGEESLQIAGEAHPVDVVGIIHTQRSHKHDYAPVELLLTREVADPESPLVMHRVHRDEDGSIISEKSFDIDDAHGKKISDGEGGGIEFSDSDPQHRGWASIRSIGSFRGTITVSEASQPDYEHPKSEWERRQRTRDLKRLAGAALAVFAFKATTVPGGVYDRVADGQTSAQQYVEHEMKGKSGAELGNTLSLTDGSGKEVTLSGKELADDYQFAVDRVAQTMGDLDEHRSQAVVDRAQTFESQHPGEIMTDQEASEYKDQLEKATTSDEALKVIDEFMGKFESTASADYGLTTDQVNSDHFRDSLKFTGRQIIEVLSRLPKQVVRDAIGSDIHDKGIQFNFGGKAIKAGAKNYGVEVAYFDGNYVNVRWAGKILGMQIADFKEFFAHEMSHAIFDEPLDYKGNDTRYGKLPTRAINIASHLLGSPEFTSDYATSDSGEETAEDGSDILRGEIANPDHVLDFESRANSTRLRVMVELEQKYPGITDYLILRLHPGLLDK